MPFHGKIPILLLRFKQETALRGKLKSLTLCRSRHSTKMMVGGGRRSHHISPMIFQYGGSFVTDGLSMSGRLVTSRQNIARVHSRLLSGGACNSHALTTMFSIHRFMVMVHIEFSGLAEFAEVAGNYHHNTNKLYGNFDKFTLAIDNV